MEGRGKGGRRERKGEGKRQERRINRWTSKPFRMDKIWLSTRLKDTRHVCQGEEGRGRGKLINKGMRDF